MQIQRCSEPSTQIQSLSLREPVWMMGGVGVGAEEDKEERKRKTERGREGGGRGGGGK